MNEQDRTSTEQPTHELVDFVALSKQLTNEQKILAVLERIEVLLTPVMVVVPHIDIPISAPKAAGSLRRK
jgi:hypothetical protein